MSNIKAIVFDLDGVFKIGNKLINGVENILEKLNKKNIQTMIVTNECRYTVETLKNKLKNMGLNIPDNTLFYTAALSCKDYIEKKINRFPKTIFNIGIVGENGLYKTLDKLNKYNNFNI